MNINKKRFTDKDVDTAIKYCQNKLHFGYWDLSWVYIYRYTVSNKECIEHMEKLANNRNDSLVNA